VSTSSRPHHPGIALTIVLACALMLMVDATVVTIALPDIGRDLGFSATGLSWTQNAYTLAFGGLLLLGGRAGDILGRRRTLISGVVLFTIASLLGGLATSTGWLLGARAAQGVGAALAGPSVLALIATNFDGHARTRALSMFSAVSSAGGSLGLIAGGMLTDWVSWRWVLFVNVPIGAAVAALAPRFIREPERHRGRFDLAGALTSTLGMVSLVYAFIRVSADGWTDGLALAAFAAALVLLTTFVRTERRVRQPITPLHLFADGARAAAYAVMMLLAAAMFGMFYFLTLFMQEVLRFSPLEAGIAFLPMTLTLFATVRAVPRLIRRLGTRPLITTGIALLAVGLTWLAQISATTGYATGMAGPMLLFGIGAGLSFNPLYTAILAGVPARDSGAASGAVQATQQVGGSVGLAVLVTVFGTASRHAAAGASPSEILADGIGTAFTVGTVLIVAALAVSLIRIRPPE
jgi:EmrB/QacA subfamily drug resistance transporter